MIYPIRPRRLIAAAAIGLALASCDGNNEMAASPAQDPIHSSIQRAMGASGLEWTPTPTEILEQCRSIASMSSLPILCPQITPRPSGARLGEPHVKASMAGSGPDRVAVGFYFVYVAEPDADAERRPFIHFTFESAARGDELAGYGADPPAAARRLTWGETRGTLSPPTGDDPAHNHAVFLWAEGDVRYAASLHDIGRQTRPALRALVASLEPA